MNTITTIQERINFLQRFVIVHSYIYYELDNSVISDKQYDEKARELVRYKNAYPNLWKTSEYYKQFGDDYTGATGFTLFHDLTERQQDIIMSIARICIAKARKEEPKKTKKKKRKQGD